MAVSYTHLRGGRSGIRRGRGDARSRKPQPFDVQVRHLKDSDQHENGERRHCLLYTSAALGIDAVLLTPACHDPLFRRASRVSMGTVFQLSLIHI